MEIQKAINEAEKISATCIRRPIGWMKVRVIQLGDPILMTEMFGPVGAIDPARPYALTPDDLTALNWSAAPGVTLSQAPEADFSAYRDGGKLDTAVKSAAWSICTKIEQWEPVAGDASFSELKALTEALESIGHARADLIDEQPYFQPFSADFLNSLKSEPKEETGNDNQQETGE